METSQAYCYFSRDNRLDRDAIGLDPDRHDGQQAALFVGVLPLENGFGKADLVAARQLDEARHRNIARLGIEREQKILCGGERQLVGSMADGNGIDDAAGINAEDRDRVGTEIADVEQGIIGADDRVHWLAGRS